MLDQGWFIKVRPMGEEVTELVPDSCVLRGGESWERVVIGPGV